MLEDLSAFLQQQKLLGEDTTIWGTTPLRFASYLSQELPPLDLVTSVRAVVLRDDTALVVRDPSCFHILPGGRREPGESLLQTLRREVLEETGWTLADPVLLGFRHFHHLGPRPENFAYIYPDFFQLIYAARAQQFQIEAMQFDEYVLSSDFQPLANVCALPLGHTEFAYLDAAVHIL